MDDLLIVRSPHTGAEVGRVTVASPEAVEAAVTRAREAFLGPVGEMTPFARYELLMGLHQQLREDRAGLARLITDETGKTLRDSASEVERALSTTLYAAEEAKRIHGRIYPCDITATVTNRMAHVYQDPVGVVAAITPFNFPLNTVLHKVAPAIAAGNTVVLKPSPKAPLTAERLGRCWQRAGAPPHLFTIVQGGATVGEQLAAHPAVRVLNFTGSTAVGRHLTTIAGLKKLLFELGGNDPLILMPDGEITAAVRVAVEQGLGSCGQRCTAIKRIFVHEQVKESFLAELTAAVQKLRVGDPLDPATDLGPLISPEAAQTVEERVEEAVAQGAVPLVRGRRDGAFLPPVVLDRTPEGCALVREETFGPVLPVFGFVDLEVCIRQVNDTVFGLQAGVFTNNLAVVKRLRRKLEVGTLVVNGGPGFRIDAIPFGGVKESGLGREGVIAAVREMTEERVLIW